MIILPLRSAQGLILVGAASFQSQTILCPLKPLWSTYGRVRPIFGRLNQFPLDSSWAPRPNPNRGAVLLYGGGGGPATSQPRCLEKDVGRTAFPFLGGTTGNPVNITYVRTFWRPVEGRWPGWARPIPLASCGSECSLRTQQDLEALHDL